MGHGRGGPLGGEVQTEARTGSGVNTGERLEMWLEGVGKRETRREKVPKIHPGWAWRQGGLGVP